MPTVVAPGQGLAVENPVGGVMTFKATASETAGVRTAIDTIAAPGEGPPLHDHAQDELIYTLEGRFRVKLGDTIQPAEPGSFVFIPGGTPHTWQNVGDQPARFFATIKPAATAFEKFFRLYAELPGDERGVEAFARLAVETKAFDVLGPPLAVSDPLSAISVVLLSRLRQPTRRDSPRARGDAKAELRGRRRLRPLLASAARPTAMAWRSTPAESPVSALKWSPSRAA